MELNGVRGDVIVFVVRRWRYFNDIAVVGTNNDNVGNVLVSWTRKQQIFTRKALRAKPKKRESFKGQ